MTRLMEEEKTRLIEKLKIWDGHFWIGQDNLSQKRSVPESRLPALIQGRKEQYHIEKTFFSHFDGLYYSPKHGNDTAAALLKTYPEDLFGILFFEQHLLKDPDCFRPFIQKRFQEGFRILKLLPKSHKYPFEKNLMHAFYETLDALRFPVMIGLDELDITGNKQIEWDKVQVIAQTYEQMPIILDGGDSKELMFDSYLLSLLANSGNLFLTTHQMLGFNQIEDLAGFGRKSRLLFDTYYPFLREELSVFRLLHASLKWAQVQDIAKGSLEKIVKGIAI